MVKKARPRAGSLAFYPKKKAKKETASFSSFPSIETKEDEQSKPLNFLAYKAGMTHALGKDMHEKGVTFGHEVAIAATVLEAPPLRVFGIRAYGKAPKGFYGTVPIMDEFDEKVDKALLKKIPAFKKKLKRKKQKEKETEKKKTKEEERKKAGFSDLEKEKEKILAVRLLCHSQPGATNFGKKKPDICELALSDSIEKQLQFAKQKLGQEITISEVFAEKQFVDVKAVTKGKGMQGPVKRFGIKKQRPKAKKRRVVGSIGPWNPSTVMWQVARPGQTGYQTRTEYNKKVLKIGTGKDLALVNIKSGFKNYGILENDFVMLAGSIAGPAKRAVSIRLPIRTTPLERHKVDKLDYVAGGSAKPEAILEEEIKVEHTVEKKEEKKEEKSVQDEISAAVKGEQKKEKPKEK